LRAERVLAEDGGTLALDKPPGISVMGERHDDDIVELAARAGEELFPVHRIDKVTSGIVLLARTLAAHGPLTRQFADRSAAKGYLAVVEGVELPDRWTIDLPLGVGRKNRVRIAAPRERLRHSVDEAGERWTIDPADVIVGKPNYPSVTEVHRLLRRDGRSLVLALPRTGRRHQIRVHLAWTGTPIVGDPLFGAAEGRTHLHSWRLRLPGTAVDLVAPPDAGFVAGLTADPGSVAGALAAAERLWAERPAAGRPG
jgi:tRNA pseudouridine32 synthase/23S rRNA pseudouridine746 synthase/23S rRNA pseudouridine1911/1915/1917 synthase